MKEPTIGCDPEFFVTDLTDEIVPICGKLGGTKTDPVQVKGMKKGFMYQEDGAAAEFNVPPTSDSFEFAHNVSQMVKWLEKLLGLQGLKPSTVNNLKLKPEWVKEFPKLGTIGCDPDYIAYNITPDNDGRRILNMQEVGLNRGAGGHIHVGYDKQICPPSVLARLMDACIGLPLSALDKQGKRRSLWGKAGLFREKPYGMEYRTLSNFWIWSPDMAGWISTVALRLVKSLATDQIPWQAFFNIYRQYQIYSNTCIEVEVHRSSYNLPFTNSKVYQALYEGLTDPDPMPPLQMVNSTNAAGIYYGR